jgi:hypothetical protein
MHFSPGTQILSDNITNQVHDYILQKTFILQFLHVQPEVQRREELQNKCICNLKIPHFVGYIIRHYSHHLQSQFYEYYNNGITKGI